MRTHGKDFREFDFLAGDGTPSRCARLHNRDASVAGKAPEGANVPEEEPVARFE